MEVKNSVLCLFDKPAVQTDFLSNYRKQYFPLNTLDTEGPIEFRIEGNADEYIDVNDIQLYVRAKVSKADGSKLDSSDKVGLTNLPIASLFRDVTLHLGTKQIEGGQMNYPYLGYFNTVMQFSPAAQASHMTTQGWYKDTAGKMDIDTDNAGYTERAKLIEGGKVFELMGPLFLNFCRQGQFLLSDVGMVIKFLPNEPEFACFSSNNTKVKIQFDACTLAVPRYKINPSVIIGHNHGLKRQNAIYPLQHAEVQTFTIPAGNGSHNKDHLFPDQAPNLLYVAMVENAAYNGSLKKNPFNFQHFGLNKMALYKEGCSVPGLPFEPDFSAGRFLRDYINTMNVMKYSNSDETNGLTPYEFANGYTIYAFDLTPDNAAGAEHRQVNKTHDLRLELVFEAPLKQSINVIMFCVYDSAIEITHLRDVITHYGR